MKIASLLAASLVLAAMPASALTNDFSNKLRTLSSTQQRAVMRRAVLDEGKYCKRIGPVAYQQSYKNLEMWTVQCDRGANYAAFIGLDGTVQVRPCRDLAALKLPACRLPKG